MLVETLRSAALVGLMATNSGEVKSHESALVPDDHVLQYSCRYTPDVIFCPNFQIERTTPNATTMVDVVPRVYDWQNWRQWRAALLNGWEDGLDFIYQRGCIVTNRARNYTDAHMTVTVANPECTGIAPNP